MAGIKKRLIVCCDGTWMDSDDGFTKPSLFPYVPTGTLQVPSNVTRISRALKRKTTDGISQIIAYHSGVGTSSSSVTDVITGGALGKGISENIREAYSFIATNYVSGDEIILIGFSRGAFTARSVAGMIDNIGLLTREGMASFYAIFKDQENFRTPSYRDIFPTVPFSDKPRGPNAARDYKRKLEELELTRIYDPDEKKIIVQAVAVWDTVGSLGIPNISLLSKLGLPHSTTEYRFYNTDLSGTINHAFQALALDERRQPFAAAVWERKDLDNTTQDLRQVWFPGSHGNCGGGYDDQEISNISLAWMMDQLASIGVAFEDEYIDQIFQENVQYFENLKPKSGSIFSRKTETQWAIDSIYEKHKPVRPWGLGEIRNSSVGVYALAGKKLRTPGLNIRSDPDSGQPTGVLMENTNERIHSCVRIRLDLEGLDVDDGGLYKAQALSMWRLRKTRMKMHDPIRFNASWGPQAPGPEGAQPEYRWIWEYDGPEEDAPRERIMVEENLGPYERKLLLLNKGRSFYKKHNRKRRKKRERNSNHSPPTRIDSTYTNTQMHSTYNEKPSRRHSNHRRHSVSPESSLIYADDPRRPASRHDRPPPDYRERERYDEIRVERDRERFERASVRRSPRYEDEIVVEVEEEDYGRGPRGSRRSFVERSSRGSGEKIFPAERRSRVQY